MLQVSPSHISNRISIIRATILVIMITTIFLLIFNKYGITFEGIYYIFIASCLVMASFIDISARIIPNKLNLLIGISGIVFVIIDSTFSWKDVLTGTLIGGGGLYLLNLLSLWLFKKEGMGGGDIKLAAASGVYLGAGRVICAFYLSSMVAILFITVLILFGKLKKGDYIPYGPFLSIGILLSIMYYEDILSQYLHLLLG